MNLTRAEERALGLRIRAGDMTAATELADRNRGIVHVIARRCSHPRLSREDLVSTGMVGLMEAARRFDPDRGVKFISYAAYWIQREITGALGRDCGPAHVPVGALQKHPKLWTAFRAVGMDDRGDGDNRRSVGATLAQDTFADPLNEASRRSDAARLRAALRSLTPVQRGVLEARFGLMDGEERTFREIAVARGVSKARIQQIEIAALEMARRRLSVPLRRRRHAQRPRVVGTIQAAVAPCTHNGAPALVVLRLAQPAPAGPTGDAVLLERFMERRRLSQTGVGRMLGCSQSTVYRILHGQRDLEPAERTRLTARLSRASDSC